MPLNAIESLTTWSTSLQPVCNACHSIYLRCQTHTGPIYGSHAARGMGCGRCSHPHERLKTIILRAFILPQIGFEAKRFAQPN